MSMVVTDTTPFYKRLAFNLASISLLCVLIYVGQDILMPLLFSILLSVLLLPVFRYFLHMGMHKVVAILVTITITAVLISTLVYFVSRQMMSFFQDMDKIQVRLDQLYYSLQHWVKSELGITITRQNQYIRDTREKMDDADIVSKTVVSMTTLLTYLVLLPIYTFLILYYKDMIRKFLIAVFRKNDDGPVLEIISESRSVSRHYILGLMIEMVIVFILNASGFLLLGIKYALFLALISALLNLVPYLGMLVANAFCMLITLVSSDSLGDVVWVGVILAVVQLIDNNILMTMVVGSKVKINALATLVGVLVGGALCGIPGMFLSIPVLATMKVVFDRVEGLQPYGLLLGDDRPVAIGKTCP